MRMDIFENCFSFLLSLFYLIVPKNASVSTYFSNISWGACPFSLYSVPLAKSYQRAACIRIHLLLKLKS